MTATVGERYDALAPRYDERYVGPLWEVYDEVTLDVARTRLPPSGRVLDAGAGSGKFARWFLERGYEVTLLDPSREMLARAREKLAGIDASADYLVGSIESIEARDGAFDFVFCEGDPLSYTGEVRAAAAGELLRVLRPGGGLYVSCDNRGAAAFGHLLRREVDAAALCLDEGSALDPYGVPVHAFGLRELAELLRAAGAREVRAAGKLVYAHLLPPRLIEDAEFRARLCRLERRLAREIRYAGLASHLHATAVKR